MSTIRIDAAPEQLQRSNNPLLSRKQGEEPHAAATEGVVISSDWQLFADGCEVPVYATPVTRGGPHSFAQFDYFTHEYGVVHICAVPLGRKAENVQIAPKSKGITAIVSERGIEFDVIEPGNLTLTVNEDIFQPITLFVNPPEEYKPDETDEKVLYFKKGCHQISFIDIPDGGTLYIEGGAIVTALPPPESEQPLCSSDWAGQKNYRSCIEARQVTHVTVCGRGILDYSLLPWHARSPLVFHECRNVLLEGVTFVNVPSWTIHVHQCQNVQIQNVKLLGYRENSDGIDIVSSVHVHVSDCFIRTGDDAVAVKAMSPPPVCGGRDIYVEKCVVWNDKVRCFGIAGETQNDICDVTFRNCDVIRSYADWTQELGSLVVYVCDRGIVSNVLFENIRIEHEVKFATNLLIKKDFWSKDEQAGRIHHVTFKNISADMDAPSNIAGYDKDHKISYIDYDNFVIQGRKAVSSEDMKLSIGSYTEDVTVK